MAVGAKQNSNVRCTVCKRYFYPHGTRERRGKVCHPCVEATPVREVKSENTKLTKKSERTKVGQK